MVSSLSKSKKDAFVISILRKKDLQCEIVEISQPLVGDSNGK